MEDSDDWCLLKGLNDQMTIVLEMYTIEEEDFFFLMTFISRYFNANYYRIY
jgi:hypothetical protein